MPCTICMCRLGILHLVYKAAGPISLLSQRNIGPEITMLATTIAAFVLFAAVQCLLVVHLADKLTPGTADDRSNSQHPAGTEARYA